MTVRKLRMMCAAGDETLAEWETETISPQRLNEIEVEFQSKMRQGYFAVNITGGRNTFISKFDSKADILLIPAVRGGGMGGQAEPVSPQGKNKQILCEILPLRALQEFFEEDYFHHV